MLKTFLSLTTTVIFLTGCATTKSMQYPVSGSSSTVSVSSEQISSMTESGGGDHFINNSQITVGDASRALNNPASNMFGLIGVGVATAIDKRNNASAIEKSSLNQAIKFDQLVHQKIQNALSSNQIDPSLKVLAINQISDIKVTPYSRISFINKPDVSVAFSLKAQFKNAADNNANTKRIYHYVKEKKATLSEWDNNKNAMYLKDADTAFTALAKVLVLDMQHQINIDKLSESKQKTCKVSGQLNHYYYIESPDDLCIGVFQTNKGVSSPYFVFVVEQ